MSLEVATAVAGAVFVFFLILWLMRGDGGGAVEILLPPKHPIGFAPSA